MGEQVCTLMETSLLRKKSAWEEQIKKLRAQVERAALHTPPCTPSFTPPFTPLFTPPFTPPCTPRSRAQVEELQPRYPGMKGWRMHWDMQARASPPATPATPATPASD